MSLSSLQLDAFLALCRRLNFSRAAKVLGITQSALTQRIQNLESELSTTLFIRDRRGVRFTETAQKLLRYCQFRDTLEEEFLSELRTSDKKELAGIVRVAAYSSVLRSVIIPVLSPLLQEHSRVRFEVTSAEMAELPVLLQKGETDFIVLDHELHKAGIEKKVLGWEEYVLIESKKLKGRKTFFLDHDLEDTATTLFFEAQNKQVPNLERCYLDDVYGVLDGVSQGLGRAVMSRHLLTSKTPIQIVSGYRSRRVPVILHYYVQPFYSRLQKAVIDQMVQSSARFLSNAEERSR